MKVIQLGICLKYLLICYIFSDYRECILQTDNKGYSHNYSKCIFRRFAKTVHLLFLKIGNTLDQNKPSYFMAKSQSISVSTPPRHPISQFFINL
jgi:hypothetical protein